MITQFIDFLSGLDTEWFILINQKYTGSWFDSWMPFMSDFHRNVPYLAIILLLLIHKMKTKTIPILLGCILSLALSDLTAARVIKPLVKRPRPEFTVKTTRLIVPSQASYGFPSNHAANTFAVATFLLCTYPLLGILGFFIAGTVAYSRVYVGVHYPFDVMGGALLGMFWAVFVFRFYLTFFQLADPLKKQMYEPEAWKRRVFTKR